MDFTVPEEIERLCDGVRRFFSTLLEPPRAPSTLPVFEPATPTREVPL